MDLEPTNFAAPRTINNFDRASGHGVVSYGLDDGLIVTFFIKPKYMEFLSKELAHPIFQDRIMTRIIAPGNNKTVWEHETKGIKYDTAVDPTTNEYHTVWEKLETCENGDPTEADKYPKAWAAFLKKDQPADLGWPIEEWGAITRSMAESLKLLGVPTVEALAALTDQNVTNVMGGRKWRDLAKADLNEREKRKLLSQAQNAAEKAEDRAKGLETKVEELEQVIMSMQREFASSMGSQGATPTPLLSSGVVQKQGVKSVSARQARGRPPQDDAAV